MKESFFLKCELFIRRVRDIYFYWLKNKNKYKRRRYDVIFSLGYNCYTSIFLIHQNLRKFSGPLDWVTGSDFNTRFELFLNNFDNYFNKEDLQYIDDKTSSEPIKLYKNTKTNIYFPHDFSFNGEFNNEYPNIKEKYKRRIQRLYKKINNAEKILAIYIDFSSSGEKTYSEESIVNFVSQANKKFNKKHFDLLYIKNNSNIKDGEFNIKQITDNFIIAECFNIRKTDPDSNIGNEKNVRNILQFFRLR